MAIRATLLQTEGKMINQNQQKVDNFHSRVYALGGAVSTGRDGSTFAAMSIPGILTKFESIEDALARLDSYENEQNSKA